MLWLNPNKDVRPTVTDSEEPQRCLSRLNCTDEVIFNISYFIFYIIYPNHFGSLPFAIMKNYCERFDPRIYNEG